MAVTRVVGGAGLWKACVLDASDGSARLAGKLLTEMGADVVRLRTGEAGPPMTTVSGGLLDWWHDGGTSLLPLELDRSEDRARLLRLVTHADVLIETEAPGRLDRLGLDQATLATANPSLVHVSMTPFGGDGPRATWQSSDLVMAAAGGILSVNGFPDEPVAMWGRQMDNIGGFHAAICALAGLVPLGPQAEACISTCRTSRAWCRAASTCSCSGGGRRCSPRSGAPIASRQGSLHWIRAYDVVPVPVATAWCRPARAVSRALAWMTERGHAPTCPKTRTAMRRQRRSPPSWLRCASSRSSSTRPRCS